MESTLHFLTRHGYALLLAWVFAEQIGVPVPALPVLLAAGALAGTGHMSLHAALLGCIVACLAADWLWYELGRSKGIRILQLLCKISLEPDSCVRRTEDVFARRGARTLLFAKFVPGLNTVAPPLAGVVAMGRPRFLFFDALGSLLWSGTFLGLGFLFSGEIERLAESLETMGGSAMTFIVAIVAGYIIYKLIGRYRLLSELRVARIGVDDLKAKLDAGEPVFIVDLRHALDAAADPETIPGAHRMNADELQQFRASLPHDREVILFCT